MIPIHYHKMERNLKNKITHLRKKNCISTKEIQIIEPGVYNII